MTDLADLTVPTVPDDKLPADTPPTPPPPTPPRRGRPPKDKPPADAAGKTAGRPSVQARREARALAAFGQVGLIVFAFAPADGAVIMSGAPTLAASFAKLAEVNPSVAKVLDSTLAAGVWLEVLGAIAMIAIPIAGNHGLLPAGLVGMIPTPPADTVA